MDLRFKIEREKIMFANAIELGRVLIMVAPLATWPILTLVLEDRRRKINSKGNRS